jgi:chemotaxis protein MotB
MLRFLSAAGVPEERLAIVGYADRRPIVSNGTEAGRQKNRRVDVVLLKDASNAPDPAPNAAPAPAPAPVAAPSAQ